MFLLTYLLTYYNIVNHAAIAGGGGLDPRPPSLAYAPGRPILTVLCLFRPLSITGYFQCWNNSMELTAVVRLKVTRMGRVRNRISHGRNGYIPCNIHLSSQKSIRPPAFYQFL